MGRMTNSLWKRTLAVFLSALLICACAPVGAWTGTRHFSGLTFSASASETGANGSASLVMDPPDLTQVTAVNGNYSLAFSGTITTPENMQLDSFGLVLTNQRGGDCTADTLVIGGKVNGVNVAKLAGQSLTDEGRCLILVNSVKPGQTRTGRLYAIVRLADNSTQTVYSDTWSEMRTPCADNAYAAPVWTWADDHSSATASFVCAVCGDEVAVTDASPVVNEITGADCENDRVVTYTASAGFFDGNIYTDTTDEISVAGTAHHSWADQAEYIDEDTHGVYCAACGIVDPSSVEAHDFSVVVSEVPATEDMPGVRTVACAVCGYEKDEEIPPLSHVHTYGDPVWEWLDDYHDGSVTFTCTECGEEEFMYVDSIDWEILSQADCTTDEVANCIARVWFNGTEYTDVLESVVITPAYGHSYATPTWVWAAGRESARMTVVCDVCSYQQTVTDEAPAQIVVTPASCTTDARICYRATVTVDGTDYSTDSPTVTLPDSALGHDYDAVVTEPTCTAGGYTTCACSRCGDSYTKDETSALGHEWSDWTVTKKPSFDEEGQEERVCARCGGTEDRTLAVLAPDAFAVCAADAVVGCGAGRLVKVNIDLTHNPGIIAARLHIGYDAQQLKLIKVENGTVFADAVYLPGGTLTDVPYTVLWSDAEARTDNTANGTLVTLTFAVQPTATVGDTAVTVTVDDGSTFNTAMQLVNLHSINGTVSVVDCLSGDADNDGSVDLADIVSLARYIAGGWDVTIHEINADVNGDGVLNLKDVVLIRRFLAGGWDVVLI